MKAEQTHMIVRLAQLGLCTVTINELMRISRALHRWHELECGVDGGGVQRDENGIPYWYNAATGKTMGRMRDGQLTQSRKLASLEPELDKLGLIAYVQTDPRGCALYIVPKDRIRGPIESCYNSGVAVTP